MRLKICRLQPLYTPSGGSARQPLADPLVITGLGSGTGRMGIMAKLTLSFKDKKLKIFPITGQDLVVGRDPACTVHIDSLAVQPRHARIFADGAYRKPWGHRLEQHEIAHSREMSQIGG